MARPTHGGCRSGRDDGVACPGQLTGRTSGLTFFVVQISVRYEYELAIFVCGGFTDGGPDAVRPAQNDDVASAADPLGLEADTIVVAIQEDDAWRALDSAPSPVVNEADRLVC
ncbi:hypothetical protein BH24ACT11_BH24ACT11_01000 [soil metagenome]